MEDTTETHPCKQPDGALADRFHRPVCLYDRERRRDDLKPKQSVSSFDSSEEDGDWVCETESSDDVSVDSKLENLPQESEQEGEEKKEELEGKSIQDEMDISLSPDEDEEGNDEPPALIPLVRQRPPLPPQGIKRVSNDHISTGFCEKMTPVLSINHNPTIQHLLKGGIMVHSFLYCSNYKN